MRIMDKKVTHNKFGAGTVFALKGDKVYVSFGKIYGEKQFPYPEIFEGEMRLQDDELQEEVLDEARARKRALLRNG